MHFTEIEALGVGLAADVAGQKPDYRQFIGARAGVEHVDYLNVSATHDQLARLTHYIDDLVQSATPFVFHPVTLNPVHAEPEPDDVLAGNIAATRYLGARWAGQDAATWTWQQRYLGHFMLPGVFDEQGVRETAIKVDALMSALPCPFVLENPPVTFAMETMHVLDYMGRVAAETDCGLVLDVGHLIAYQVATGRAPTDMPLDRYPFERVVEVHLAGLQRSVSGPHTLLLDYHAGTVPELSWAFLEQHLPRMRNLKGITLEHEYCEEQVVARHLRRVRKLTADLRVWS